MLNDRYWTRFEWRELIVGSIWHVLGCQFLLASGLYRWIPGLSEALVRDQLRIARKKHGNLRRES
jgi:hypothetical protein